MSGQCHFIGIGGIGMSGLARILRSQNKKVSGSDIALSPVTEELEKNGIEVFLGHAAQNISSGMTVIYSTDIKKDNPEYQAAVSLKCTMLHRSELLQQMMGVCRGLAVAGSHGKTTVSSLLSWVLHQSKLEPSFAVGGIIAKLNSNAEFGSGQYFVAEACESDGTFLNYHPYGAIVTNIDFDHMDFYRNEKTLVESFQTFMSQVSSCEHLFWCGDDSRLCQLNPKGISYGFGSECQLKASNWRQKGWNIIYDIDFQGRNYHNVEVALTGKHNVLNSLAVFGLALTIGIPESAIRSALISFGGVGRRCEKKGESHGILVLDDYAHHPVEIKATLKAIRQAIGDRRLVVAYQPHRYTRALDCLGQYDTCFDEADALFMTEIYAAGELPLPEINDEKIFFDIKRDVRAPCFFYSKENLTQKLAEYLRPHDVLVTLGAGDITRFGPLLLDEIKRKGVVKTKVGVIYGGASVEHEVSLLSAAHICSSLSPEFYEIEHFGICRNGEWICGSDTPQKIKQTDRILPNQPLFTSEVIAKLQACEILFPVLHGSFGEDGTIQGLFEMLGKAYVGCCYRSSSICMDKAVTKRLMLHNQIPTSPFVEIRQSEWKNNPQRVIKTVLDALSYPVYVKPTHLGSSIGVKKVENEEGLTLAIENAFLYDTNIIVEKEILGRELEFAAYGNETVTIFPPGEICTSIHPYDYHGKYSAVNGTPTLPKAELAEDLIEEGRQLAEKAYRAAGCSGMARVDVFLDGDKKYWLNEINPIPGFTPLSLYPRMCEENGLKSRDLIDQLIILGLQRKRASDKLEKVPRS